MLTAVGDDRCKLYCHVDTNKAFYYRLESKVIDGTKCHPDTSDICVNGRCVVSVTLTRHTCIDMYINGRCVFDAIGKNALTIGVTIFSAHH